MQFLLATSLIGLAATASAAAAAKSTPSVTVEAFADASCAQHEDVQLTFTNGTCTSPPFGKGAVESIRFPTSIPAELNDCFLYLDENPSCFDAKHGNHLVIALSNAAGKCVTTFQTGSGAGPAPAEIFYLQCN